MLLFCFTSLRNFSVKPSPISQPIKIKIETNRDLVHCSFLRLTQFASFSMASHWLLVIFSFPLIGSSDQFEFGAHEVH